MTVLCALIIMMNFWYIHTKVDINISHQHFFVWQEKNLFLIMRNNYSKWCSPVVSLLSTIRRMFIVWKRNRNCVVHKKWSGTTQQMCAYRRFGHSNDLLRFQSQQKVYTKHSNNEQSLWLWYGLVWTRTMGMSVSSVSNVNETTIWRQICVRFSFNLIMIIYSNH